MWVRFRTAKGAAIGAALMYYFDPQNGRSRRVTARDRWAAQRRRVGAQADRQQRYLAGVAEGERHQGGPEHPPADDRALADRIRSELGSAFPHAASLTVVDGVAELRGELPDVAAINELVTLVAGVADVVGVLDLLHVPGTLAPNKAAARLVSAAAAAAAHDGSDRDGRASG